MAEPIRPVLRHKRVLDWQSLRAAEMHGRRIGPSAAHCATAGLRTIAYSKFSPDPYDLVAAVKGLAAAHGAVFRDGASVAQEALFGLSPHAFASDDPDFRFNPNMVRSYIPMVVAYYDANFPNQVAAYRFDFDESNFHGSAFVCPVAIQRTNNGKEKLVISVRSRFGTRRMLREHQFTYAKAMAPLGAVEPRPARETGHIHVDFREFHRKVNQDAENLKTKEAKFELDCRVERLRLNDEADARRQEHARTSQALNALQEKFDLEYRALGVAMECIQNHSLVLVDDAGGQKFAVRDETLGQTELDLLTSMADQSARFRNTVVALLRCQSGAEKPDVPPPAPSQPPSETEQSVQSAAEPTAPANSNVNLRRSLAINLAKSADLGDARFIAVACIHLLAKAVGDQKLADEFSGLVDKFLALASHLKLTYAARDLVADLIRLGSASSAESCLRDTIPDARAVEQFLETMTTHNAPDDNEAPDWLRQFHSKA